MINELFEMKEWCRKHIDDNSIWRMGQYGNRLPSKTPGELYAWQFYLRRSLYDQQFQEKIGDLYFHQLRERFLAEPFQLAACETAGVPLAMAIQNAFHRNGLVLNCFSVRKERKRYGLLNWFEGIVSDLPVVLVDDIAGSQETLRRNEAILRASGVPLANMYLTLVNKVGGLRTRPHSTYLQSELVYLFDLNDFETSYLGYVNKYGHPPKANITGCLNDNDIGCCNECADCN